MPSEQEPQVLAEAAQSVFGHDTERRVRVAAREWTATVDALADALCVTNAAGEILRCNHAFALLVDRPFSGIVGERFDALIPAFDGTPAEELLVGGRWFRLTSHAARGEGTDVVWAWLLADITERKRTTQREAVEHAVAQLFASTGPREGAMREVLRVIGEGLAWCSGAVWVVDAEREMLRCVETWRRAEAPAEPSVDGGQTRPLYAAGGLLEHVWTRGEPSWVSLATHDSAFPFARPETPSYDGFAFPVRVGGSIAAIVTFFSAAMESADRELLGTIDTIASQIGYFIERTRAHTRIEQLLGEERRARAAAEASAARDAFLAEAGNLLASSLDYEYTLGQVTQLASHRFAHWCAIDLFEDDGQLRRVAQAGHGERFERLCNPADVARTRRPALVSGASDGGEGAMSCLAVPLLLRDRVHGTLCFGATGARQLTDADVTIATRLAVKVVLALDNARLFRDVQTAVQRKDETLAFLDTVLRTAPVGLAFLDRRLRVVQINNALAEMIGRPAEQPPGDPIDDVIPPEWRSLTDHFRRVFETGEPILDLEWNGDQPGHPGRIQHVMASYYPIRDLTGTVSWVGIVVTDVTERRRVEEAVRQTQKLESIGLLAGGIAHDFNNLLTGILGNASLARRALPPGSGAAPMLVDVVRAGERAAALTSQLLAYAGKGRFYVQAIDLGKLVHDITRLIRTSIPKKVSIEFNVDPTLPFVEADAGQLQQVVMNLVINGAEAIGDAPGTVTIEVLTKALDMPELHERFATFDLAPGRYVCLEVRDSGCGMDAATQACMFDPFFTSKFTGRGLGLAAVLGIIRGHRGGIAVESELGRGTTFSVLLPALATAPAVEAEMLAMPRRVGAGTVLVADDEEIVRRIARTTLQDCGYTVVEATNGLEAVDLVRQHGEEFVVVLLDMTMPVMGGDEAVRHLKRYRPTLPVLAMSGYGELEAIRRFTGTGIDGFLQKPYTAEQLLERLEAVLVNR